jgi:hypothetical protein
MTLGDVFNVLEYDDVYGRSIKVDYVYLHDIGDITFCAKILNKPLSNKVQRAYTKVINNPLKKNRENDIAYSFVALNTKEFKDRIVHFANTENNPIYNANPLIRLIEEDVQEIKKEIISKEKVLNPILVAYIKSLK